MTSFVEPSEADFVHNVWRSRYLAFWEIRDLKHEYSERPLTSIAGFHREASLAGM